MIKNKLITCAMFMVLACTSSAQYIPIVSNDSVDDFKGWSGVPITGGLTDVKNLSYILSTDKKKITFRFETYDSTVSTGADYIFYIDEDNNPTNNGWMPYYSSNKSMKQDREIRCTRSMGGVWQTQYRLGGTAYTDMSADVAISFPDTQTALITIPLNRLDSDGDGRFNLIAMTYDDGIQSFVDDLPNIGFSSLNVLGSIDVGLLPTNNISIAVYPNPASDVLTVILPGAMYGYIQVSDMTGKAIATYQLQERVTTLLITSLAAGRYQYRIVNETGTVLQNGRFDIVP